MATSDGFDRSKYPEIPDAQELWYHDWYDGPLCGVAMVGEQPCYYIFVDEQEYDHPEAPYGYYCSRIYELRPLTGSEFSYELGKQNCWRKSQDDELLRAAYYQEFPPFEKLPYQDRDPIGWTCFHQDGMTLAEVMSGSG